MSGRIPPRDQLMSVPFPTIQQVLERYDHDPSEWLAFDSDGEHLAMDHHCGWSHEVVLVVRVDTLGVAILQPDWDPALKWQLAQLYESAKQAPTALIEKQLERLRINRTSEILHSEIALEIIDLLHEHEAW